MGPLRSQRRSYAIMLKQEETHNWSFESETGCACSCSVSKKGSGDQYHCHSSLRRSFSVLRNADKKWADRQVVNNKTSPERVQIGLLMEPEPILWFLSV